MNICPMRALVSRPQEKCQKEGTVEIYVYHKGTKRLPKVCMYHAVFYINKGLASLVQGE